MRDWNLSAVILAKTPHQGNNKTYEGLKSACRRRDSAMDRGETIRPMRDWNVTLPALYRSSFRGRNNKTYEGLKYRCILNIHFCQTGNNKTYEGLKFQNGGLIPWMWERETIRPMRDWNIISSGHFSIPCSWNNKTYEGLKLWFIATALASTDRNNKTYEGLKYEHWGTVDISKRLETIRPMRDWNASE